MLNYKTISAKQVIKVVKNNENVEMYDLLTKSTKTTLDLSKYSHQTIIVPKEYVARPDLIALAVYGDDRYGDVICKINNISNPFELNEDMVLLCPSPTTCDELLAGTAEYSDIMSASDSDVIETLHQERNNISSSITNNKATISKLQSVNKKKTNDRRSPAEQTVNDTNYVIDKSLGIVIY